MKAGSPTTLRGTPIREICDQYEGEWLLIRILDASRPLGDSPGQLLAHGPEWGVVFKADRRARKEAPTAVLTIIKGGTKFGDGDALRRPLSRIAAEEEWVSVNNW
jgi:hypothetical protein